MPLFGTLLVPNDLLFALMPVLKTLVETEIKQRFRGLAKARGLSESELLRAVVMAEISHDNDTGQPAEPDETKLEIERITVRMPGFLMDATKERAKKKQMAPSRWVAALVQSNLMARPVMSEVEILALQASNRELAAIGRNINQMAKAINQAFYDVQQIRLDKLGELATEIIKNRDAIRALVRASQGAWGIE